MGERQGHPATIRPGGSGFSIATSVFARNER
jgi:hypothetical protein